MPSMTIRNLNEQVKSRLRVRAAQHGRSMEEEAREILASAVAVEPRASGNLFDAICKRIVSLGGVGLPEIEREPIRLIEIEG